ncbi:MAG: Rpn family recombination-promoting nuclease/putative transposase [Planctomycetaceae bacterium]|jgi:predicted transposase/invertase (TIGR01784 family)|nr:Rpn family recombination-promoting nuclease/putative transposase [Planctomycetaceae bacterium]
MQVLPNVPTQVEIAHPHDLIVRYFLTDTELFTSLLENFCVEDESGAIRLIDFNSIKCESPTTIDNNLQEVIGDLRFSAQFKNKGHSKVFFFFEHQSTKVNKFCFRCLRKLLEFYEGCDTNPQDIMQDGKYPYAFVVVLYHGETQWDQLLQMRDLVSFPTGVDRNYLSFPAVLIDMSQINRNNLKGHPALIALLDMLQSASENKLPENFDRIVSYFEPIKDDPRTYNWLTSMTRYFLTVTKVGTEIVVRAISKIFNKQETEKMVMSTLEEQYVRGIEKGEIKGKIEGKIEGKIQIILNFLNKRFHKVPDSIVRSLSLYTDAIALDSLAESAAFGCETLEEFEQELAH